MSQRVYRVCRAVHARLDGEGAKRVGGRWNSPGHAVVYMAQSISLAVLENLAHMSRQDFPTGYVSVSASIPDELSILSEQDIKKHLPDAGPRELGDHWLESGATAVLRVRSAVIPEEFNYLLNPAHPEFARILVEPPKPFVFDEGLLRMF
ncbi:MAG TPA: RES family NAD+ phosphorylase [Bryobacteraceae bacterium]|nr:RES family NAD+ phosphorylase [Bryobacteraceae bacterium]